MSEAITKDFIAASATPLILSILSRGDSYGYAIIRDVRDVSDGELSWEDGTLYPILHRLEKRKLVSSYPGVADNGRKRKYYRIEAAGRAALEEQRSLWLRLTAILQKLEGETSCLS